MKYIKYIVLLLLVLFLTYCFSGEKNTFILCLGDSITGSNYGNYPTHLNKLFVKNKIACTAITRSKPGNTSGEYLKYFKKSKDLKKFKPKIVVLMLGTNDVRVDHDHTPTKEFKENMTKIIDIIREYDKNKKEKVDIYLCTIPPILKADLETFTEKSIKRIDEEIVPAIEELAVEHNLQLIDLHSVFQRNKDLLPGVHPSPGGYFKMAKVIYNRVRRDSRTYCISCEGEACEVE